MCIRFFVTALFLVSLTSVAYSDEPSKQGSEKPCTVECEPGEEYTECGHTDPTCENPSPPCKKECIAGCFCANGNVRAGDGRCIQPSECSKYCHRRGARPVA